MQYTQRQSDVRGIKQFWQSHSDAAGPIMSIASGHWILAFCMHDGRRYVVLHGPESKPVAAVYPANGTWVGIQFAIGTVLPRFAQSAHLVDGEIELPNSAFGFWLGDSAWEYPTFDNIDVFAERMMRAQLVHQDMLIADSLARDEVTVPARGLQRRFLEVTGMSRKALRQIERARTAAQLLRSGVAINDTVTRLGYYDQSHLTTHLHQLIGFTPAKLQSGIGHLQLSIL